MLAQVNTFIAIAIVTLGIRDLAPAIEAREWQFTVHMLQAVTTVKIWQSTVKPLYLLDILHAAKLAKQIKLTIIEPMQCCDENCSPQLTA